jgi:hypothetical protein
MPAGFNYPRVCVVTDAIVLGINPSPGFRAGLEARLASHIQPATTPDACDLWLGSVNATGMPRVKLDQFRDGSVRRLRWMLAGRVLPADSRARLRVRPTCSERCVSVDHAFLDPPLVPARTREQYHADLSARRREREAARPRPAPRFTLSDDQVAELVKRRERDKLTWREAAELAGYRSASSVWTRVYRWRRQNANKERAA